MNNDLTPQNSMKSVIEVISQRLKNFMSLTTPFTLIDLHGIGSNGAVFSVQNTCDGKYYAMKLLNISYYIIRKFELDKVCFHESAYKKYSDILFHISSTEYHVRQFSKMLPKKFNSEAERNSFFREFLALKRLPANSKTAYVVDYGLLQIIGTHNGKTENAEYFPYIIMPLFQGITLSDLAESIHNPEIRFSMTLHYIGKVIDIVEFIHDYGIIHRDLYPNNFLVSKDKDSVHLVDFGSAIIDTNRCYETDGERRGARRFMSMEQFASPKQVDYRSDYFFIGSILFYLITLRTPFMRNRSIETEPLKLSDCFFKPEWLDEEAYKKTLFITDKLLSVQVQDRFQCMNDIQDSYRDLMKTVKPR